MFALLIACEAAVAPPADEPATQIPDAPATDSASEARAAAYSTPSGECYEGYPDWYPLGWKIVDGDILDCTYVAPTAPPLPNVELLSVSPSSVRYDDIVTITLKATDMDYFDIWDSVSVDDTHGRNYEIDYVIAEDSTIEIHHRVPYAWIDYGETRKLTFTMDGYATPIHNRVVWTATGKYEVLVSRYEE